MRPVQLTSRGLSIVLIGAAATVTTWPGSASADTVLGWLPVAGKAAIFDAGQITPTLDGLLPPVFELPDGVHRHFTIESISGTVTSFLNNDPYVGPGGYGGRQTDINSANGISGITCVSSFFLTGVFLGDGPPTEPAPTRLNYAPTELPMDQEAYRPVIGQTFFIGDGLVGIGTGSPHRFIIPTGATRLFLGFADAGQFQGDPGAYADNYGWLDVRFRVVGSTVTGDLDGNGFVGIDDLGIVLGNWNAGTPPGVVSLAIPEPATFSMLALMGACGLQYRRGPV